MQLFQLQLQSTDTDGGSQALCLFIRGESGNRCPDLPSGIFVPLPEDEAIDTFIERVGKAYKEKIGYAADFYVVEIGDGPQTL